MKKYYLQGEYYEASEIKDAVTKFIEGNPEKEKAMMDKIKKFLEPVYSLFKSKIENLDDTDKLMIQMAEQDVINKINETSTVNQKEFSKVANSDNPLDFINFLNQTFTDISNDIENVSSMIDSLEQTLKSEEIEFIEYCEEADVMDLASLYIAGKIIGASETIANNTYKIIKTKHELLDYTKLEVGGPAV